MHWQNGRGQTRLEVGLKRGRGGAVWPACGGQALFAAAGARADVAAAGPVTVRRVNRSQVLIKAGFRRRFNNHDCSGTASQVTPQRVTADMQTHPAVR